MKPFNTINKSNKQLQAFTLAEMMVVLMVSSLVIIGFLPVMTRQLKGGATGESKWSVVAADPTKISYGSGRDAGKTKGVVIGDDDFDADLTLNAQPAATARLIINTSSTVQDAIIFKKQGNYLGRIHLDSLGNVGLGNVTMPTEAGSNALTSDAVAVGLSTKVAPYGVAVGHHVSVEGEYSTAVGNTATTSTAINATAIGYNAQATANNSTAIGALSRATGLRSTAAGWSAQATAEDSTAIGYQAKATAICASAFGADSEASSPYSTAFGGKAKATTASQGHNMAIGYDATATGERSIAIGSHSDEGTPVTTTAASHNSIAIGHGALAQNNATQYNIALGYKADASGERHIKIGRSSNQRIVQGAISIGYNSDVNGHESIGLGAGATISSNYTIAIGNDSVNKSKDSIAIGYQTSIDTANDTGAILIGSGLQNTTSSTKPYSIKIGSSATEAQDSALFNYSTVIGSGSRIGTGVLTSSMPIIGSGNYCDEEKTILFGSNINATINSTDGYTNTSNIIIGKNITSPIENDANRIAINSSQKGEALFDSIAIGYNDRTNTDVNGGVSIGYNAFSGTAGHLAIGALSNIGAGNMAIGHSATMTAITGNPNFYIGTGTQAIPNNYAQIGDDTQTTVYVPYLIVGGGTYYYSDKRLKNIGSEFTSSIDKIKLLKPYKYTYKADEKKIKHTGVIAQDLQKIFPDSVFKDPRGYLVVNQEEMFYAIMNSIKEIHALVQNIKNQVQIITMKLQHIDNTLIALNKVSKIHDQSINKLSKDTNQIKKEQDNMTLRIKKLNSKLISKK